MPGSRIDRAGPTVGATDARARLIAKLRSLKMAALLALIATTSASAVVAATSDTASATTAAGD